MITKSGFHCNTSRLFTVAYANTYYISSKVHLLGSCLADSNVCTFIYLVNTKTYFLLAVITFNTNSDYMCEGASCHLPWVKAEYFHIHITRAARPLFLFLLKLEFKIWRDEGDRNICKTHMKMPTVAAPPPQGG